MHRPPLLDRSQRRSNKNNKKRKKSSSWNAAGNTNDNGQKSKNNYDEEHEILDNNKEGRKRPRKADGADGGKNGTSEPKQASQSSPLQSIIMGYYQLFLPLSSTSNNGHSQSSESEANGGKLNDYQVHHFTKLDIQNSETATAKLLEDLTSITSSRNQTSEVFHAFANIVRRKERSSNTEMMSYAGRNTIMPRRITPPEQSMMMNITIDKYMTHPTTCSRRAYASSLFDRILDLGSRGAPPEGGAATRNNDDGVGRTTNYDNNEQQQHGDAATNPALRKFLQKLLGLATDNGKIREVVILLMLEPMRRLQQQQRQQHQQTAAGESSSMDLAPLLTSSSFWATVSAKSLERACSRPHLRTLAKFILQTCPRIEPFIIDSEATVGDTAGNNQSPSQTIDWWTLPSPLLCTISQWHFPIACKYIRYWIDRTMTCHNNLYTGTFAKEEQSSNDVGPRDKNSRESKFQHAILRIKQFCSTSERLHVLGAHVLNSVERESREVSEATMMASAEEKNGAFGRTLAWKAIYQYVFSQNNLLNS